MDELTDAMKQTMARTGWNDPTLLVFALRFLHGRSLTRAFETYLERLADEEEAEVAAANKNDEPEGE